MMHNEPLKTGEKKDKLDSHAWISFNFKGMLKKALTLAGLASLAMGHVVEDVFHGTAMG